MSEQKVVQLSIAEFESDDSDDSSEDDEQSENKKQPEELAVRGAAENRSSETRTEQKPKASRRKILDSVLEMQTALEYLRVQKEKDLIARYEKETKLKEKKEKKRLMLEEKKKQAEQAKKQADEAMPLKPPKLSREISHIRF